MRSSVAASLVALATVLCLLGLTSCGSNGNGVASGTDEEILAASKMAAQHASSVHILSTAGSSDGHIALSANTWYTQSAARGKFSLLGLHFEAIRVNGALYLKGGPGLYEQLGIAQNVRQGTWVKADVRSRRFASLAALTDMKIELNALLVPTAHLAKGRAATVAGHSAIGLTAKTKWYRGTLYVSTTGHPYPLELVKHGRETGRVRFTDWDRAV